MTRESPAISIAALDSTGTSDRDLEDLLKLVYGGGGFTEPSPADSLFAGASVRARGHVLVAKDNHGDLLGSVVVVPSGSPAARFAISGDAELLYRRNGFGRLPGLDFARGERTFQVFAHPI